MPEDVKTPADTTGTINTPDLSPSGKVRQRAISGPGQAWNIITSSENASRDRNLKNARIQAKVNSERPFTQSQLDQDGLGWKSNFTTKPLPLLVAKVAPRFVKAEQGIRYLTNSALPDDQPGARKKTEAFRREITTTIRSRPGWEELIQEIAQENALFGFTSVAWLDEFHWFPKHFRQDKFHVPSGTKHIATSAQIFCFKESPLISELFKMVSDQEAATAAGWDVENTLRAINTAMPENRRTDWSSQERALEDLNRESNLGGSLENGALTVTIWHVFAEEVTGKISHYILRDLGSGAAGQTAGRATANESDLLFEREDQFEGMEQVASLFSFEHGNGNLHSSKGIGRQIYSMAAMLDRARNEVVDRLNLGGKLVIQCDDKAVRRFKASVVGPALLIGQGYNISERKIDPGVENFMALDQFLTALLDQMVGATTPKFLEGDRVTKAQIDLLASREEETRDNIIGRFLIQFARMTQQIQRRLCDENTADKDAQAMQERLLRIMSPEELDILANQPVADTIEDYTEEERQKIIILSGEAKGNPLYNGREMERRKLSASIDEEFADAVLLPEEDPTIVAEQSRLQQLELLLLTQQATQVAVSPRDGHEIHLSILMPALESIAQTAMAPDPADAKSGVEVLHAMLDHATQHFQMAQQAGVDPASLAEVGSTLQKLQGVLEQITNAAQAEDSLAARGAPIPPAPTQ